MNSDLSNTAVQKLTAQIGEALFDQPGMTLMEIANRRAEIEAMRKDAERYRFIRDADRSDDKLRYDELMTYALGTLDEAIDAAMKEHAE